MAVLPARPVPVPAFAWVAAGHDDEVGRPGLDVAVATGAPVALQGLVGLDASYFDRVGVVIGHARRAHSTRPSATTTPATTNT
jgi:hypothetical protein